MIDGQRMFNVTLATVRLQTKGLQMMTSSASKRMRTSHCATGLDGLLFTINAISLKVPQSEKIVITMRSLHGATRLSMLGIPRVCHIHSHSALLRTMHCATFRIGLKWLILAIQMLTTG